MPLIDMADLMERMMGLLAAAATPLKPAADTGGPGPKFQSLLAAPMPDLNAGLRSFAQVYGAGGRMLAQLSLDAAAAGTPELATLLSALDQGLREGAFDLAAAPPPARRLVRYVYPVV